MPNEPPLAQASARKPGRKPLGEQPLTGAQRQPAIAAVTQPHPSFAIVGRSIAAPGHSDGATR